MDRRQFIKATALTGSSLTLGHMEFTGLAEYRVRTYAAGTARRAWKVRASRIADVADRGKRR